MLLLCPIADSVTSDHPVEVLSVEDCKDNYVLWVINKGPVEVICGDVTVSSANFIHSSYYPLMILPKSVLIVMLPNGGILTGPFLPLGRYSLAPFCLLSTYVL